MTSPTCTRCRGTGWVPDAQDLEPCACRVQARNRIFLGEPFKTVWGSGFDGSKSPLVRQLDDGLEPLPGNLLVTGEWKHVLRHIAFGLLCLYNMAPETFRFQLVTDAELVQAHFAEGGQASAFARLVESPGLVIIRLGYFRMRGPVSEVLLEALMARGDRPIWMTTERWDPWAKGHSAWSELLDAQLRATFKFVKVEP
jgi:hypothetical protein